MKKKYLLLLTGLLVAASLFGCGKKENTPDATASSAEQDGEITGYLVDNAEKYVTLSTYKGLDVEKPIYEVSDDELSMEIENELYDHSNVNETDRASQMGDLLTIDLSASVEGDINATLTEEDYTIELGYEEFGSDFDEQLTGVKAGDTKKFSCDFTEDSWYEDWIGKTVNFDVTVKKVEEIIVPEYTDDFVTTTLGYDSKEDFEAALREELEAGYASQSTNEARENAMLAALENCKFNGYPDKLYDSCKTAVKERYSAFADAYGMSEEDLYDAYDMSEEDIETEVMDTVNRRLFISALCQKEGLSVTDAEYNAYLEEQYALYGYEDAASFEADMDKEFLMWSLYETKTADFLLNNASVYEAPMNLLSEDMDVEEVETTAGEEETMNALIREETES